MQRLLTAKGRHRKKKKKKAPSSSFAASGNATGTSAAPAKAQPDASTSAAPLPSKGKGGSKGKTAADSAQQAAAANSPTRNADWDPARIVFLEELGDMLEEGSAEHLVSAAIKAAKEEDFDKDKTVFELHNPMARVTIVTVLARNNETSCEGMRLIRGKAADGAKTPQEARKVRLQQAGTTAGPQPRKSQLVVKTELGRSAATTLLRMPAEERYSRKWRWTPLKLTLRKASSCGVLSMRTPLFRKREARLNGIRNPTLMPGRPCIEDILSSSKMQSHRSAPPLGRTPSHCRVGL